jgi:hypothetical protein
MQAAYLATVLRWCCSSQPNLYQPSLKSKEKWTPAGVYPREGGGWGFARGGCSLKENPQRLAAQALAQWEAGPEIFQKLKRIGIQMVLHIQIFNS